MKEDNMKKILAISLLLAFPLTFMPLGWVSVEAENLLDLEGKVIALDAGHGGNDLGAQYPANCAGDGEVDCHVYEKDVNLVTVYNLKEKLEGSGAKVVLTREADEEIDGRKERVEIAKDKCEEGYGQECDILVSVHHNGSTDETYDGVMTIYNNRDDFPLAESLRDSLLVGLFNDDSYYDHGFDRGGYGMTVYFTPASLTEGYYITNKCEAHLFSPNDGIIESSGDWEDYCPSYIYGEWTDDYATINFKKEYGVDYELNYGPRRVDEEGPALYQGIVNYFESLDDEDEEEDNGGDEDDDGEEKELEITKFKVEDKSNPAWTRAEVTWAVQGNKLETIKLEMFESDEKKNLMDSKIINVSNAEAEGVDELRSRDGGSYVVITVTDADGKEIKDKTYFKK